LSLRKRLRRLLVLSWRPRLVRVPMVLVLVWQAVVEEAVKK